MNNEFGVCDFCKEQKVINRFYISIKHKHFDDNIKGQYAKYFSYCNDCGIDNKVENEILEKILYIGNKIPSSLTDDDRSKFILLGTPQEFIDKLN